MHDLSFLQNMHVGQLAVINNVNFTPREIDIISCLLNVRGTNKIASLLSIAPNTVLTHIHNIILKLGCNSREGVIDFIEKSHKFPFIKQHYANLIIYAAFEKILKEVSKLNRTGKQVCLIVYGEDQNGKDIFIRHLKDHLKQVGISAEILGAKANNEIESVNQKKPNLRLFLSKKDSNGIFREHFEVDFLDISEQSSYYLSVFEILKKLLPATNLSKIITNFKEQYEGLHGFFELKFSINSEEEAATHKKKIPHKAITLLKNKKGIFLIFIFFVGIVYFIIHKLIWRQEMWFTQEKKQVQIQNLKQSPIRSTFVMPAKSSFLDRPELIAHIHHKFKEQQDIPIIALVGPGAQEKPLLLDNMEASKRLLSSGKLTPKQ